MEAAALGHAINLVDVYSNSWGPPDSGFYFMEPGPLTKRAIKRGIVEVSIDKSFDVLLLPSLLENSRFIARPGQGFQVLKLQKVLFRDICLNYLSL